MKFACPSCHTLNRDSATYCRCCARKLALAPSGFIRAVARSDGGVEAAYHRYPIALAGVPIAKNPQMYWRPEWFQTARTLDKSVWWVGITVLVWCVVFLIWYVAHAGRDFRLVAAAHSDSTQRSFVAQRTAELLPSMDADPSVAALQPTNGPASDEKERRLSALALLPRGYLSNDVNTPSPADSQASLTALSSRQGAAPGSKARRAGTAPSDAKQAGGPHVGASRAEDRRVAPVFGSSEDAIAIRMPNVGGDAKASDGVSLAQPVVAAVALAPSPNTLRSPDACRALNLLGPVCIGRDNPPNAARSGATAVAAADDGGSFAGASGDAGGGSGGSDSAGSAGVGAGVGAGLGAASVGAGVGGR
jgi:hypothetical protein